MLSFAAFPQLKAQGWGSLRQLSEMAPEGSRGSGAVGFWPLKGFPV